MVLPICQRVTYCRNCAPVTFVLAAATLVALRSATFMVTVSTGEPPDSWSTDLVADVCRDRVGITEAGVAGGIRIRCDRTRPCVDRASVGGNCRAEGGVASVGPHDRGLGRAIHDADVVADELLLEIVVGRCLRVRRGGAHLDGF